MKKMMALGLLTFLGFVYGQYAWDTGAINFNYGSPFPNQSVAYTGSLLSSQIPAQGAGGFEISQADTNILSLLAYDIHVTDGDTLADIFAIIIQDSAEIAPGYYVVGVSDESIKGFIWLQDVDPALVAGLIDTSFNLDSLSAFNPFISLTGQIEITEIDENMVTGNFAGTMINTSMDFMVVADGLFSVSNTLPDLSYDQGQLTILADTYILEIEGELNPLQNDQGVGGVNTQQGDTLTTTIFAYTPNDTADSLSIYGVIFRALAENFPEPGEQLNFEIGSPIAELPMALPFFLENASLEQFVELLATNGLPEFEDTQSLYLPMGTNLPAVFVVNTDSSAFASFTGVLMANSDGSTLVLSEDWSLSNSSITSIDQPPVQQPAEQALVGNAFPNPFNSSTIIPFTLTEGAQLDLVVYNLLGQELVSLGMGVFPSGSHNYPINLGQFGLPGGIYYFRLNSEAQLLGHGSFVYLK